MLVLHNCETDFYVNHKYVIDELPLKRYLELRQFKIEPDD